MRARLTVAVKFKKAFKHVFKGLFCGSDFVNLGTFKFVFMKYLVYILLINYSLVQAQLQQGDAYRLIYKVSSITNSTSTEPREELMSLLVKDDKAIFQAEHRRLLDSIRAFRDLTVSDRETYSYPTRYAIEFHENTATFSNFIGNDEYQYDEELALNWQLASETKIIAGYSCRMATASYGGRQWIAWFATSVPINGGPYKFRGLPGLIVKVTDTQNIYDFELTTFTSLKAAQLNRVVNKQDTYQLVKTDRLTYLKTQRAWDGLSMNEQISYMKGKPVKVQIFSVDGKPLDHDTSKVFVDANTVNYMEIDDQK